MDRGDRSRSPGRRRSRSRSRSRDRDRDRGRDSGRPSDRDRDRRSRERDYGRDGARGGGSGVPAVFQTGSGGQSDGYYTNNPPAMRAIPAGSTTEPLASGAFECSVHAVLYFLYALFVLLCSLSRCIQSIQTQNRETEHSLLYALYTPFCTVFVLDADGFTVRLRLPPRRGRCKRRRRSPCGGAADLAASSQVLKNMMNFAVK